MKRSADGKARDRMLAILDNAAALVAMADNTGALFYLNAAGRAVLGLAHGDDVSGMTLIECVAPGARARMSEQAVPAAIRNGVWSGDSMLGARAGNPIDASMIITAHYGAKDRLEGISLLAQDISVRTRCEEALRVTQNDLLRRSAQRLAIQEAERKRIAADLHDGLGQSLSLVNVSLEIVSGLLNSGEPEKAAEYLDRLKPRVKEMVEEVRGIAMNLRPAMLDSLGILATLSWYFRELDAACPSMTLKRDICVEESDVPKFLKTPIFRILQEASRNAIRHARAHRITVRLRKERGALELSLEDDGQGFDPVDAARQVKSSRGLGLESMRERALLSCGIFELQSAPGNGTRICVRWPLSLNELALDRAAVPDAQIRAMRDLGRGRFESARDISMLHNLLVCVACIRSIKNIGR